MEKSQTINAIRKDKSENPVSFSFRPSFYDRLPFRHDLLSERKKADGKL
jgi:hypothetical protein